MALRKPPACKTEGPVSAREVRELSKLPWVRDEALSRRLGEARVLPDGRVLVVWGATLGTLFPSREAFAEVQRRSEDEAAKGPVDLTRTLLPPIADFLRDVKMHAARLGTRLRIAGVALDGSEASLEAVDTALRRIPWAKRMVPELVTPLVAYVGEVMRGVCGGGWTVSAAPGHENEPMIAARDGQLLQPFALVVVPMAEPGKRVPLRAAVEATLLACRPSQGTPGPYPSKATP